MKRNSAAALSITVAACFLFNPLNPRLNPPLTHQAGDKPEIISLLGRPFYSQADEKGTIAALRKQLEADPANPALMHQLGKQLTRPWRFNEGIDWMTRALERKPADPILLLDRGHAYVNVRKFKEAQADLERAAALDANNRDIFYHLGLAHYFQRRFARAAEAFRRSLDAAGSDDSIVAASDWLYMSLERAEKKKEAASVLERITASMQVKENAAYYARLLLYKGLRKEEELVPADATPLQLATFGYGIGNWHLYNGRAGKAKEYFEKIVRGEYWPAFGFIGAEVELKHWR